MTVPLHVHCLLYYYTCMSHYNRHQKSSHTLWPLPLQVHCTYTERQGGHCSPALKWAMHCQETEWSYNDPIFRTPSLMTVWIRVLFCLLSPKLFIKWHHGDRTVHTRCIILLAPTFPCINKMFKLRLHSGLLTLDCQLPSVVSHTNSLPSIWVLNWVL